MALFNYSFSQTASDTTKLFGANKTLRHYSRVKLSQFYLNSHEYYKDDYLQLGHMH